MTKKTLITALAVGFLVAGFSYYIIDSRNNMQMNELPTNPQSEQTIPTETPGSSAPPFALEACVNKTQDETCNFEYASETYNGICAVTGTELACTPALPE